MKNRFSGKLKFSMRAPPTTEFGMLSIVLVPVRTLVERHEMSRVSFNGGPGGLRARPSAAERLAMSGRHAGPTVLQRQHEQGAAGMPGLHASENGGRPQILTTRLPADFSHPGPGLRNHPMPPAGAYGHAPRQGGGHNGPPREQGRREAGPPRDR